MTQNYFKFDDNYYAQTGGTMIGTPFGPEYSCLTVGKQEIEITETQYDGPGVSQKDILMIFWVQLQCLEKILIDLLILSAIYTHPFNILSQFLKCEFP